MTPLEFLAVVLPSPGSGYYCAVGYTKTKKEHDFEQALENLLTPITSWHDSKKDCYFALATFAEAGSRKAENARFLRSLFIDMDGYASKKEAAESLKSFMFKTGLDLLGTPYIVGSGGGLHVYWPLTEDVEVARWKPIAEAFKRLCKQEDMRIDMSVTADAARILRVPDTTNFKAKYATPRPVRLLAKGDTFDFQDLSSLIISGLKSPVPALPAASLQLPGTKPTSVKHSATAVKLFENSQTKFKTILHKTKDGLGCGQILHYIENAAEEEMEPLWRATLSIAQKCEDGQKAAVWLSDLHPYDHERMRQKLDQIKGPYSCVSFDSINPGVCEKCPHWGKITNPLALGRETAVSTEAKVVEVSLVPEKKSRSVLRPEPPRGYAYGQNGGVFVEKEDIDQQGNITKKHVMLLPYDVFPIDILNNGGDHLVHLFATRNSIVQEVMLPQKAVASKDETIKYLMNQNIVASFGAGNDKNLYDYIRACVEKLSTEKNPIVIPQSYGWQDDDSYVFAGCIYRKGEEPIEVPMPGLENIIANTKPTGVVENWVKVVNMMIRRKMWDHLAILLFGAGAPLMRFTGLYGMTVHCASSESGTGKSLALDTAASVWGHPVHYRTGSGTSAVAMQQRLGLLRSNPLITDEITTNNRVDFEWFPAFLFSMSEGRGKERMESGANKERLNLSIWQTIAIMSSNRPAVDYMTGARQHSSEGELRRLIEYGMDEKLDWNTEEIEIIKSLQNNYAVVGDVLVRYFVSNVDYLKTLLPKTIRQMYDEFNAPNDERFWMAGCACAVAAGILLNEKHANVVDIPMQEIIDSLRRHIDSMRVSIKGGKRSAEDVLNAFIQEYQGRFVVVKYGDKAGPLAHFHDGTSVGKTTTRADVMGRVEHGVTAGCIDFFIEERLFKSFCSNMSFSYSNLKKQLEAQFTVSYVPKKDMMSKTDAPPMRVSAMKISRRISNHEEAIGSQASVDET